MNTIAQNYDYTVTLIKREQKSISLFENSPLFVNLVSPSHKDTLSQVWSKQWPSVLEKTFKFCQMYFHYIVIIFHWKKDMALHLNTHDSQFTQGCFMQNLVEIGPVVLEEKIKM